MAARLCEFCGKAVNQCKCGILLPWQVSRLEKLKGYIKHKALD